MNTPILAQADPDTHPLPADPVALCRTALKALDAEHSLRLRAELRADRLAELLRVNRRRVPASVPPDVALAVEALESAAGHMWRRFLEVTEHPRVTRDAVVAMSEDVLSHLRKLQELRRAVLAAAPSNGARPERAR